VLSSKLPPPPTPSLSSPSLFTARADGEAWFGSASLSRIERKLETLSRIEAKIDAFLEEMKRTKEEQQRYPAAQEAAIILASNHTKPFPWGAADINDEVDEIIHVLGNDKDRDGISKEELEEHREFIGALVLWKDGQDSNAVTISKQQEYGREQDHARHHSDSSWYHNAHSYPEPRSRDDEQRTLEHDRGGIYTGIKSTPLMTPARANASSDQLSGSSYRPPHVEDDDEAELGDRRSAHSSDFIPDHHEHRRNSPNGYYSGDDASPEPPNRQIPNLYHLPPRRRYPNHITQSTAKPEYPPFDETSTIFDYSEKQPSSSSRESPDPLLKKYLYIQQRVSEYQTLRHQGMTERDLQIEYPITAHAWECWMDQKGTSLKSSATSSVKAEAGVIAPYGPYLYELEWDSNLHEEKFRPTVSSHQEECRSASISDRYRSSSSNNGNPFVTYVPAPTQTTLQPPSLVHS